MTRTRPYPGGIHVPCLTFFKDDARQEIDWELQDRHFDFLVDSGLHGSKYPTPTQPTIGTGQQQQSSSPAPTVKP
jgi:hypothetical protein